MNALMSAWEVASPAPIESGPLRLIAKEIPTPVDGEILVRVLACGACRTDLHIAEGDLTPHRPSTIPGHQVVGEVVDRGPGAGRFRIGETVGIAWLRHTCGSCDQCRSGAENLCPASEYTGWDADGGFGEYAVVAEAFAYALPPDVDPERVAPLLCAGIIGYRALRRANLPPGGRLGIFGFGSSAHITAQIAAAQGAEIFALTRDERHQQLARELGAVYVGGTFDAPPMPLDAVISFAPAGELIPLALTTVRPGGTVVVAGIYSTPIPALDYERHLFHERDLRTVTSNTRRDGEELLRLASRLPLRISVMVRPMSQVPRGIADLKQDQISGSLVFIPDS